LINEKKEYMIEEIVEITVMGQKDRRRKYLVRNNVK